MCRSQNKPLSRTVMAGDGRCREGMTLLGRTCMRGAATNQMPYIFTGSVDGDSRQLDMRAKPVIEIAFWTERKFTSFHTQAMI